MLFKKKSSEQAIQELTGKLDGVLSLFTTAIEGLEAVEDGLKLIQQNEIVREKSEVEDLQMKLDAKLSNIENSEKLIKDIKAKATSVIAKIKGIIE